MPYITREERQFLESALEDVGSNIETGCTPGQLNYIITIICLKYLNSRGKSYTHINDIIGVLECAKQEFYRKIVINYENQKAIDNGDVY